MFSVFRWIDDFCHYGWPAILAAWLLCTFTPPLHRRYLRGKLSRWWLRKAAYAEFLWLSSLAWVSLVAWATLHTRYLNDLYWGYLAVAIVVNLATGGDDPGKRVKRWLSEKVKKLRIAPPPKPAINFGVRTRMPL